MAAGPGKVFPRLQIWIEGNFGVTFTTFVTEVAVRIGLVCALVNIGTSVDKMPEIDEHLIYKYSYPTLGAMEQTVPLTMLAIISLAMAILLFIATHFVLYMAGRRRLKLFISVFHYVMATSMSVLACFALVQLLKLWVSRPRPDFLSRCFPHRLPEIWNRIPTCTRPLENPVINDGIQSFPSGHAAAAWSVSVFCFLFLREQLRAVSYNNPSHVPRCLPFLVGFLLAIYACYVSCSRLWDYQHHPEDILVGGVIGIIVTYFSFELYYPIATFRYRIETAPRYYSRFYDDDDDDDVEDQLFDVKMAVEGSDQWSPRQEKRRILPTTDI